MICTASVPHQGLVAHALYWRCGATAGRCTGAQQSPRIQLQVRVMDLLEPRWTVRELSSVTESIQSQRTCRDLALSTTPALPPELSSGARWQQPYLGVKDWHLKTTGQL